MMLILIIHLSFEIMKVYEHPKNISSVSMDIDKNGNIYILDEDKDIVLRYGRNMEFLAQFGGFGMEDGRLNNPEDISVNNYVYILDRGNKRIVKYDLDGNFLISFGEFDDPVSISQDVYGDLYVVDRGKNKVKVYNKEGENLYEFGEFGWGEGFFNNLEGIAVDENGNIYVSENGNHRIQVLTNKGRFIRCIGEDILKSPKRIRYWKGFIFCIDGATLYIFDEEGEYIFKLEKEIKDIGVDNSGNIYLLENGKIEMMRLKYDE
uniref:6-bladed beta-propeller n=1 Tax=candidate division WOR-3 bacterium TaxID=2052148 RepID=A0A7C4U7X4_UNCW3